MRIKLKKKINPKVEVIRNFRKQGRPMSQIGEVLGISKQGVHDFIKRYKIDEGLDK